MKTMKKILLSTLAAVSITASNVSAQYLKAEGQEYMNRFSTAPAYAGYNGNDEAFLGYRAFMSGIDGATKLLTADVNGDLGETSGYGIGIINEKSGNFNNLYAGFTYAHHLRFSDQSGLSFGITPALIRSSYNIAAAKTFGGNTDPVLANEAGLSGTGFDAGFSIMLNVKGFYFSVYVPRLICQDLKFQNGIINTDRQIFANLSFAIESDKWEFEPSAEFCYPLGEKAMEWKAGLTAKYTQRAWFSLGYNSEKWLGLGMGFSATNRIALNYQYLIGTSEIAKACNGTHEISIGFLIQKGKKHRQPTVFFEEKETAKSNPEITKLKEEIKKLEDEIHAAKINGVLKDDDSTSTNPEPEKITEEEEKKNAEEENVSEDHYGKDWEKPEPMLNVTFAKGTAILNRSSYPGIDAFVYLLNADNNNDNPISHKYIGKRILIIVTVDQGGSKEYNEKLAGQRAEVIKAYMVSKGIPADRIVTRGLANTKKSTTTAERFDNNNVKVCRSNK
jgi:type IX secretion system PorP/SprF family membrane protein